MKDGQDIGMCVGGQKWSRKSTDDTKGSLWNDDGLEVVASEEPDRLKMIRPCCSIMIA